MPFRDPEWEDFLRDCEFFPAYTDYIFGVDIRPEVDDEPGLHPQIFDIQPLPQLASLRLNDLPPSVQYPAAYDPTRSECRALTYGSSAYGSPTYGVPNHSMPGLQRTSILRQESSLESIQTTPTPAPRQLPTFAPLSQSYMHAIPGPSMLRQNSLMGASLQPTPSPAPRESPASSPQLYTLVGPHPPRPSIARHDSPMGTLQPQTQPLPRAQSATSTVELLRPREIMNDPKYSAFPWDRRKQIDDALTEACIVAVESSDPHERAKATDLIRGLSIRAAWKLGEINYAAAARHGT